MLKLAVAGAQGRMGRAVMDAASAREDVQLVGGFDRDAASMDRDAVLAAADVLIDFTTPEASVALAELCAARCGPAFVTGATGLTSAQEQAIARAAERVAIVRSGNFSLGVNVLLGLVRQAAARLPAADWDIEVLEAHHRRKLDAPSGAALMLGEAAAAGRGAALDDLRAAPRDGVGEARAEGAIGFASVRGGGVVGEHSVILAAADEILTLSHSARDRGLFARGALAAALWVRDRPPGLYSMQNVLGFEG